MMSTDCDFNYFFIYQFEVNCYHFFFVRKFRKGMKKSLYIYMVDKLIKILIVGY